MKKLDIIILLLILILGFLIRLYRFNNPVADWHEWRQADTSSVSRDFVNYGFDLLHPTYQDLSNIPSGIDNPKGYRFVEFPIYNFFQAVFSKYIGILNLEEWGRIVSIFSSMIVIISLFFIVKRRIGKFEAFFSSFFFAFLPFSVYFSRTILPEMMMLAFIVGGLLLFDLWLEKKKAVLYLIALLLTAASILVKPYALFFAVPFVYLAYKKYKIAFLGQWQLWVFCILSIIPFILWRMWMQQYPEGVPVSSWLFNGDNIRFKPSFFYWIFGQRLSKLILGYFGVILIILGLLKQKVEKDYYFVFSFVAASIIYLFTIATGNVKHDYYQVIIIPTVSIILGRGVSFLYLKLKLYGRIVSIIIIGFLVLGMLSFSWFYIRDYFNINNRDIVIAGEQADKVLPKNAKVIVPYDGDTAFLYQTKRKGWPAFEKPIEELIGIGAQYLILASPTKNDYEGFGKQYEIISSSPSYLILKLK